MSRKILEKAMKAKNDEFYTPLFVIEEELKHYTRHFDNKVVYCNCDDAADSCFVAYFINHFSELNLKKLISTYYSSTGIAYKTVYDGGGIPLSPY